MANTYLSSLYMSTRRSPFWRRAGANNLKWWKRHDPSCPASSDVTIRVRKEDDYKRKNIDGSRRACDMWPCSPRSKQPFFFCIEIGNFLSHSPLSRNPIPCPRRQGQNKSWHPLQRHILSLGRQRTSTKTWQLIAHYPETSSQGKNRSEIADTFPPSPQRHVLSLSRACQAWQYAFLAGREV